jgi:uncharacterized protein involved in outer membrane biogenesis
VRATRILLLAVAVATVLVAGAVGLLVHYLGTDAFRQAAIAAARDVVGTEVDIGEMHVSLLSGATLRRVTVAGPPGVPGELLRAEALIVRPRLWPLLWRRVEIREIRLEAPAVRLARGEHGNWNYERLGPRPPAAPAALPGTPPAPADPGSPAGIRAPALDVLVPSLAVTRGSLIVAGDGGRTLLRADGVDLASALSRTAGATRADGRLAVTSLALADRLVLSALAAPLTVRGGEARLAPLAGTLAEGQVAGEITLRLSPPGRYAVRLEVREARAERLLSDLGAGALLSGRLHARASVEGTGGLRTLSGQGRAEMRQGRILDLPVLGLLASALHVPLLRELRFEEGSVDFVLAEGVLRTPAIRFVSRDLRVSGQGQIVLPAGTLDHEITLAVPEALVARAGRQTRAAFRPAPDGMMALDFRLWGPYDAPRTDIADRFLRGAAESILRKGLRGILR